VEKYYPQNELPQPFTASAVYQLEKSSLFNSMTWSQVRSKINHYVIIFFERNKSACYCSLLPPFSLKDTISLQHKANK